TVVVSLQSALRIIQRDSQRIDRLIFETDLSIKLPSFAGIEARGRWRFRTRIMIGVGPIHPEQLKIVLVFRRLCIGNERGADARKSISGTEIVIDCTKDRAYKTVHVKLFIKSLFSIKAHVGLLSRSGRSSKKGPFNAMQII